MIPNKSDVKTQHRDPRIKTHKRDGIDLPPSSDKACSKNVSRDYLHECPVPNDARNTKL